MDLLKNKNNKTEKLVEMKVRLVGNTNYIA